MRRRPGFKDRLGGNGCLQQLFEFAAQLGVARAGLIQIDFLLAG
jgi:hypothetical protein